MGRLTQEREIIPRCTISGKETKVTYIHIENKTLAEKKLFELENIEKELGIDLVTLFKALKNGVFYKDYKEPIRHTNNLRLSRMSGDKHWSLDNKWHWFSMEDYGKTWALTKEELEK